LLTGDHYSEVAVNIGLDLCTIMYKVAYEWFHRSNNKQLLSEYQ
jgi:hypothetical protein